MKIEQRLWTEVDGWQSRGNERLNGADLVFVFGSRSIMHQRNYYPDLTADYPKAILMGCSTAGEIQDIHVTDDSLVATAVQFEHTRIAGAQISIEEVENSYKAGETLGRALAPEGLVHAFVLSDGTKINGSELVEGITKNLPPQVTVTGGLSGDGDRFEETLVMWQEDLQPGKVAILGLYGDRIEVGYGSMGGWDSFGPERVITRSKGNVLYELDGKSALQLYKDYLGEHAAGLPATGLLFPLSLRGEEGKGLVRTVLAVDEAERSMTFAGDLPEGHIARFMKANFNRLVDGAAGAAKIASEPLKSSPDLAILISCVGRKMVLKQRIEEEVDAVREVLGEHAALTGFYSYGEICPFSRQDQCALHNQTMTITTFTEL